MKITLDFETAWNSLMKEFTSLIYKRQEMGEEFDQVEDYDEFVETSFRMVRHFKHPLADMGIEMTCDGFDAHITLFVLDPPKAGRQSRSTSALASFQISYADLLDEHEETKQRVLHSLR